MLRTCAVRAHLLRVVLAVVAAAVWCSIAEALPRHSCVHDELVRPSHRSSQLYVDHAHDTAVGETERRRRLDATPWQPIRIKPVFTGLDPTLTAAQVDLLTNKLVPDAIRYWQAALRVHPVEGPLFAERACQQKWLSNSKCRTYVATTRCGDHGNQHEVEIPAYMFKQQEVCPSSPSSGCSTLPNGTGVTDADFVLFVTANSDSSDKCPGASGSTLAFASYCQLDNYDRPLIARANFCPHFIDTDANTYKQQLDTAIHELAHALGFTSTSLVLFRDSLGNPLTPRKPDGTPVDSQQETFSCGGSSVTVAVPSSNVTQTFAERGHTTCTPSSPESCVTKVVTPNVRTVAREFFACSALQGMELENRPTSSCQVMGSHWEARLCIDCTMAAFSGHNSFVHPATLALLEDSGWYRANYSMASPMQVGTHWGFQQGCAFALEQCVITTDGVSASTGTPAHFCTDTTVPIAAPSHSACTLDRRAIAWCSRDTYANLPQRYRYFDNVALAGGFETADYCPYHRPFSNTHCTNPDDAPSGANYLGERYGQDSRCFSSTLNQEIAGFTASNAAVGCYTLECVSPTLLHVLVQRHGQQEPIRVSCTSGADRVAVPGFQGELTCIDPHRYCGKHYQIDPAASSSAGELVWAESAVHVASDITDFVVLSIGRVGGTSGSVTVEITTRDGSAKGGSHFASKAATVTWGDGEGSFLPVAIDLLPMRHRGEHFFVDIISSSVPLPALRSVRVNLGDHIARSLTARRENGGGTSRACTAATTALGAALAVLVVVAAW